MTIAVPTWRNQVSPVLDEAENFTVVEFKGGKQVKSVLINLAGKSQLERIKQLEAIGADVILCGAVSNYYYNLVSSRNIELIPWLRGNVNTVLSAFMSNGLEQKRFIMPGCRRRRRMCRRFGQINKRKE